MRVTETDKAYVAAFLDGEGTLGCSVGKTKEGWTPYLRVAFANFDPTVLQKIESIWGGSLSLQKTDVWALHLNGPYAVQLCKDIRRYVWIKKDAVDAAIKMYAHLEHRGLRLYYAIQVMEATRRGYKADRTSKYLDRTKEALHDWIRNNPEDARRHKITAA